MSGTEILSIELPSEGVTGLSMMAPVISLPLFLHALSGVFVAGIGAAAISTILAPVARKILQATKAIPLLHPSGLNQAGMTTSLVEPVPITVSFHESVI